MKRREQEIMILFNRWRKDKKAIHSQDNNGKDNNKSILIEKKQGF
jgi:hypothetical protein